MGRQSPFDPGLLAVVAVLIAIPAAIAYLVVHATEAPAGDPAADPPGAQRTVPVPEGVELVRRGTRAELQRKIDRAKEKLVQARVQRAQEPLGGWDEIIAATEREIADLRHRLEELER